MFKLILAFVVLLSLGACSPLNPNTVEINPTAIHRADGKKPTSPVASTAAEVTTSVKISNAADAESVPIEAYYKALTAAMSTPTAPPTMIGAYVDAGITLVNSYCLRWFQRLSEQDVKKSFIDENYNVIRTFGTAFLGIIHASSAAVTLYGSGNTAFEGYSKNYGDAFLLAPTSRKVKAKILNLLDDRATDLLLGYQSDKSKKSFTQAYRDLERFADLCTLSTAKEIVNNALDQTKVKADSDGQIKLTPTDSSLAAGSATLAVQAAAIAVAQANVDKDLVKAKDIQKTNDDLATELKKTQDSLKKKAEEAQLSSDALKAVQADKEAMQKRLDKLEKPG